VELESETAVYALAGLLSDQDRLIRHQAVNALGDIGGKNAISYLLQARYDPDETIRANADAILAEEEFKANY
jgi:HEAT repeat protein